MPSYSKVATVYAQDSSGNDATAVWVYPATYLSFLDGNDASGTVYKFVTGGSPIPGGGSAGFNGDYPMVTNVMSLTGFGFSIPVGEIVTTITVNIWRGANGVGYPFANSSVRDTKVQIIGATANKALTTTDWPSSGPVSPGDPIPVTLQTYTDTPAGWGWLNSINYNDAAFGMQFSIHGNGVETFPATGPQAYVDMVQIVLTTVIGGVLPVNGDGLVNSNVMRGMAIR